MQAYFCVPLATLSIHSHAVEPCRPSQRAVETTFQWKESGARVAALASRKLDFQHISRNVKLDHV